MIRFGVIGAGWFASRRHLPELVAHPEVELVALCRRSVEPLHKLADHFQVPGRYTDPAAMLAEADLDAVLICSPHDRHHEHAAAALAAGCHVLLEKPLAITTVDAADLVDQAEAAGRALEVAYNPPWWPHTAYLHQLVAAGEIGAIEAVDIRWTGDIRGVFGRTELPADLPGVVPPTLFRGDIAANGGGHLIDGGSHQVCEAMWVTGLDMVEVTCHMDSVPDDIRFQLGFTLANGAFGTIGSVGDSQAAARRAESVYYGSRGTARAQGGPFRVVIERFGQPPEVLDEAALPPVPQPVADFVEVVAGRAAAKSPGRDCVRYVAAIEAAYRAARTGRAQRVPRPV